MRIDHRWPAGSWLALAGALLALSTSGCKGEQEIGDAVAAASTDELPPMSVGTAQAIGPHRFAANVTVEVEPESGTEPTEEQVECTWLDLTHYSFQRHENGQIRSQDIRDGDMAVRRKKSGRFSWRSPRPGPDVLLKTINSFDTLIARFRSRLVVQAVDLRPEDPDGCRRFALSLRPMPALAEGESAAESLERSTWNAGHSSLPLSLDGEVLVDEFGNRREVILEGSYRKRSGTSFEAGAILVTYAESRTLLGPDDGLVVPPDAEVMFAVRRAELAGEAEDEAAKGGAPVEPGVVEAGSNTEAAP